MYNLIYISIFLLFVQTYRAQGQDVAFTEVLVLGDDETASLEYLFSAPRMAAVDSKENIYIADALDIEIKVFDRSGVYLRPLGLTVEGLGSFKR